MTLWLWTLALIAALVWMVVDDDAAAAALVGIVLGAHLNSFR